MTAKGKIFVPFYATTSTHHSRKLVLMLTSSVPCFIISPRFMCLVQMVNLLLYYSSDQSNSCLKYEGFFLAYHNWLSKCSISLFCPVFYYPIIRFFFCATTIFSARKCHYTIWQKVVLLKMVERMTKWKARRGPACRGGQQKGEIPGVGKGTVFPYSREHHCCLWGMNISNLDTILFQIF